MANPLLAALRGGRKRNAYDEDTLLNSSEDNGPSLLSRIGQGALSGVSAVGNFLDVPGSMVRDTLGGENPFDQLLTPFHDTNRLTGRDLLRKHGMVGSEDTYGNWWGGLGVELLTDPTSYLGIGALTKSGKAVKAAGLLGDAALDTAKLSSRIGGSLAKVAKATMKLGVDDAADALKALGTAAKSHGIDMLDEASTSGPLQSLLHVGIPFTDVGVHIGTGEKAMKLAGYLDNASDFTKTLAPVRAARMLLDPSAGGQFDRAAQIVAEAKYAKADQALKVARLNQVEHLKDLGSLYQDSHEFFRDLTGMAPENDEIEKTTRSLFDRTVRMATELGHDPQEALRYLTDNGSASMPAAMREQFTKLTTQAQRTRKKIADAVVAKGGKMRFLESIEPDLDAGGDATPRGPKNPVTGYRGFQGEIGTGQHLSGVQSIQEVIAGQRAKRDDLLPVQWYSESEDAAKLYADRDNSILKSMQKRNVQNPVDVFTTLHGHAPRPMGTVTKHEIDLGKNLDLSHLGENFSKLGKNENDAWRKVLEELAKHEGIDMSKGWKSLSPSEQTKVMEFSKNIGLDDLFNTDDALNGAVPAYMLLKNGGVRKQYGTAFMNWAKSKGFNSVTIAENGSKNHALFDVGESIAGLSTHHPRYADFASNPSKLKNLGTKTGSMLGREDVGRYLPTEVWKDIAADPAARGDASYIANKWGQFLGKGEQYGGDVGKHAADLAEWANEHADALPFSRESADDHFKYMLGMATVDKNLDAMHNVATQYAREGAEYPLERVFKLAGLDPEGAMKHFAKVKGIDIEAAKKLGLDADMANAIIGSQKAVNNPIWAGKIAEAVDKFNSAFKQGVTLPFPSFWTRNFLGGQYTNLAASGEIQNLADLAAYGKHVYSMSKAARDGVDPKLMEELYIHNVFKPDQLAQDVAANITEKPGAWGMPLTGPSNPFNVGQTWQQAGEPLKDSLMRGILGDKVVDRVNSIPGAKQAGQAYQTVIGTGSKASQWVEWANRVPMYMYLTREKGWDAMAAAKKVAELQIDYSKLAPFEKDVMRRLVPFYSFQRKMAPVLFNTLLERPGGVLAQTIRLENRAHGEDALTPEHVASTLAIPNPWKTPEEGQSYITGFGLPFEQTAQFFGNFPSLREAGREALSQTTPLIKAPLEWASGQSFFQSGSGGAGRPLEELDPTLSRTINNVTGAKLDTPDLLEFALSNSPLSRVMTQARTATDTRKTLGEKALNLLTGVRVTDVSPAAEDAVLRERAKQVMKDLGAKSFEKVYFSQEDLGAMSPEQRAEAEKFQALMALLATKAKERKALAKKKN